MVDMNGGNGRRYPLAPLPKARNDGKKRGRPRGTTKHKYPGCTVKESRFIDEYLRDPSNATQAAIRAGYAPANANIQASVILKRSKVRTILAEKREELGDAVFIDVSRIMREEGAIAFSDIREYPPFEQLGIPDSLAPAISSIKLVRTVKTFKDGTVEEVEEHRIALWPKTSSLERLERIHGMFEKDNLQRPGTNISVQNVQVNQLELDISDFTKEELDVIADAWERKKEVLEIEHKPGQDELDGTQVVDIE